MENTIKIGIVGYGNLGRGAEASIMQQPDMELVAVFTRRNPESVQVLNSNVKVLHIDEAPNYKEDIDVMLICGGSATDLPEQVPYFAQLFNTVDSFDTHAKIPEFFASVDKPAKESGKTSIISVGWDPGMFSINRVLSEALLPQGETYTFWGKGLSQGHSDAVRRVDGVKNGVQYTIPSEKVIEQVRNGENPDVSKNDRHVRECYIVAEEGADKQKIEHEIKTMPNYFADYDTTVHFISEEELKREHSAMPHGGFVIRSGETGEGNKQIIEYSLKLESNPEFTASVLTAYARAAHRLNKEGQTGAKTVYDVAPGYISPKTAEELRRDYL
ncbi:MULTISPECIES: diaminopimelate dehydrogenase [Oceanobacillus]|uniref:Meso-diaminopimelate D-dehydrogenase n=1 Tax=Oceanobacillus profundus TaxID=372463 RepID=A0A417YMT4_9BACI|nr:diaminopimelate dehydrogenase [Oceanobacillus profundus]MCM3398679.1 diaminopimelate dehydrogenase [Oceanobacillus profundus]MDO6447804.1 diaminopimelate dehydrogenase [Oceanobacillus profundus]RHW35122.1 diaminopimelate dehydrogenase [Oceanobacillus profundus]